MNNTLSRFLVLCSFLIVPFATLIFPAIKDVIIASVEFFVELYLLVDLVFFCFRAQRDKKLTWSTVAACISICCIFFADTLYSAHLIKITNNYNFLADCLYTGFAAFLIVFLLSKLNIFHRKINGWIWGFLIAFIVDALFSYCFLLSPYYQTSDTLAWKINGTIYMVLTIFIFALILPFAFRISDRRSFWFLNFLLLLLGSDIAIRYQDAFIDTFVFSWAELAWCSAFIGLVWLRFFSRNRGDLFISQPVILSPLVSIRSLLTFSVCGLNILFLIGILVVRFYFFQTAIDVSRVLFLLFIFWTIANEFSLWLAYDFSHILQSMFKAKEYSSSSNKIIQFNLEKVTTKTPIFEISQMINSYNNLVKQTNEIIKMVIEVNKDLTLEQITSQVSHDIRSPLAALDMIAKSLFELPEEKRTLVRSAVARIQDIANNLLKINREILSKEFNNASFSFDEKRVAQPISCLIEEIISEKRLEFRSKIGIKINSIIDENSYQIFSEINPREFMRLLSNLINNSIDAIKDNGVVTVSLSQIENYAVLSIADNGCGIPLKILNCLGQRGITYGKKDGHGLGLYHAQKTIESWDGSLKIDSILEVGTTITIKLLLVETPKWFVKQLTVPAYSTVVILDDDIDIHQLWDKRFQNLNANNTIKLLHFSSPKQMVTSIRECKDIFFSMFFLIDHEFIGFDQLGLDLIEDLGIQSRSILVTGRYKEVELRSRCNQLALQLLPKNLANFVQISIAEKSRLDFVSSAC